MSARRLALCALAAALLPACGGGGSAGAGERTVAFYGDSITSGTHSRDYDIWQPVRWSPSPVEAIDAQLQAWSAIDYSRDGLLAHEARIAADESALVVLRFGVADTIVGTPPARFRAAVAGLIAQARAQNKRVILVGLPHTATPGATAPLDAVLGHLATEWSLPFVDLQALPFNPATDLADPIHPGQAYSERIGAAVAAAIRSMP
jgi:lysophospholipase L1-like esterase